jgi:hypothetical protein
LSARRSEERDSSLEAGEPVSLERHSHGRPEVEKPPPLARRATDRSIVKGLDEADAGGQQQTVQTRLMQQARVPFCGADDVVDAEALPATDDIPTIAARAIQFNRKW